MTTPLTNVDLITLATASLAAARSAEGETAVFYAATARGALDALEEKLRLLRLNLSQVEACLLKQAPKRMTGAPRDDENSPS
jgi:hypothetical protein